MGSVEKLVCDLVAAEGPVWNEGALLFSDVQANTLYRFEEPNALSVYLQPSDYANGLAIDIDGGLLRAETGGQGLMTKRVSHLLAGETTVLADEYTGLPFNTPNDIAVRSDGTIYFTDPGFSLLDEDVQLGFRGVFRIAPDKSLHAEVEGPLNGRPNGIILSLDESLLYFADTMSNNIMSAVVQTDGSLATPTIFATAAKSPDGMTIDSVGNVFVAGGGDVEAFAPDGSSWGSISIESSARNVTFGGADKKSLYVTAKTGLYRVRMPIAGN